MNYSYLRFGVRRLTTIMCSTNKEDRCRKEIPAIFALDYSPGILIWLHNYRPADLVGRHIFFTFGGRRAVQGEKIIYYIIHFALNKLFII